VCGQLHSPANFFRVNSPQYPFYKRMGGPQSRSEGRNEEKFLPCRISTYVPLARSSVTILTDLNLYICIYFCWKGVLGIHYVQINIPLAVHTLYSNLEHRYLISLQQATRIRNICRISHKSVFTECDN